MNDSQEFTLRWRGRQSGPYPVAEINRMLDNHKIGMGHEIFYNEEWITLEAFFLASQKAAPPSNEGFPSIPLAPASTPSQRDKTSPLRVKVAAAPAAEAQPGLPTIPAGQERPRRRLVFALLAVFFGFTGVHNFYARQWMTGMLQLLLSVATSLMSFGIIASWLWAIVEAVVVRRDGHDIEMI